MIRIVSVSLLVLIFVGYTCICAESWHKETITNRDVVELISVINEKDLDSDCFHDIVKSKFDTSMEKKKLWWKASSVYMRAQAKVNPRKSCRHRESVEKSTKNSSECV